MASSRSSGRVEHALALIAAAEVEVPDKAAAARDTLTRWRARSVANDAAYTQALAQWQALGEMASGLRERFVQPEAARPGARARSGGALAMIALLIGVAAVLGWQLRTRAFDQAYATGAGEIRSVALPDGSRVDVSARTELRVAISRDRRTVELKIGDARFEVASDPARSFVVTTRAGVIEAIGTIFEVADRGGPVSIDVEQGRVRFRPWRDYAAVEVGAGERVTVREGVPGRPERAAAEPAAWREGWLVFDNQPLADALPAINAFREHPVRLASPDAGSLRLTGRFRASDSLGLLTALPRILPVEVRARSDGSVDIVRR